LAKAILKAVEKGKYEMAYGGSELDGALRQTFFSKDFYNMLKTAKGYMSGERGMVKVAGAIVET
jgi:predicted GH43/DUF377 family glycosyl hydrolase